jgi:hypothetical protein
VWLRLPSPFIVLFTLRVFSFLISPSNSTCHLPLALPTRTHVLTHHTAQHYRRGCRCLLRFLIHHRFN